MIDFQHNYSKNFFQCIGSINLIIFHKLNLSLHFGTTFMLFYLLSGYKVIKKLQIQKNIHREFQRRIN